MSKSPILGQTPLRFNPHPVTGRQLVLNGEAYYQIANYDRMRPFFMSIVSSTDHWMFISSTGALTAGRRNPDLALFPYYTDDKIHDAADITGSKTALRVTKQGREYLWVPFAKRGRGVYRLQRNLYKNFPGNKLLFEEINHDLGLTFRQSWLNSDRFGWVRKVSLANSGRARLRVSLLDGIQNVMPCGIGSQFQLEKSTLIDAYKKNELISRTGLGLFVLSSVPVDRPEPAEALKATTVWSLGLARRATLLSAVQFDAFCQGQPVRSETDVRAERGAYFIQAQFPLRPGQAKDWLVVADVNQGPVQVAGLNQLLRQPKRLQKLVADDVNLGTEELRHIVAGADGLQVSAQTLGNARHFGNVLFNVMRGGTFCDGYQVKTADLLAFVRQANHRVATRQAAFFRKLGKTANHARVVALARQTEDASLERLCREYLPLTFSRRHGDPSRPWNRFAIATRNADGTRTLNYEGNWRDIFQNWEALAVSFPGYTAGMVCRFVNASTADGYNPYRITRDGIDWEVVDPHDPWSHIGYWGDHQVIYLLKLLEVLERHDPECLRGFLTHEIFSYANVPYRIRPFPQLLANPKETVDFDPALDALTRRRVRTNGSDGKLVWDEREKVRHVNLTEKLLVSLLAKFSNFVPGAGIWLNTQRPEWNDANNALVGNGVSMVTLYYLRRYLAFCAEIFGSLKVSEVTLSAEVARFLAAVQSIFARHERLLGGKVSDQNRRRVLNDLGQAGGKYRHQIYTQGISGRKTAVKTKHLLAFFRMALAFTDQSIKANRRADGLYHAYNLIKLEQPGEIPIRRLYEMLEGQVAVLSSRYLSARESLGLLQAMKRSALYRADQHSYLLYPNRQLSRFVDKNNIPAAAINRSRLLKKLITDGNRLLVESDVTGTCHFNATITNGGDVSRILGQLAGDGYAGLVRQETAQVLEIFEKLFDHQSFTGRSGTFFGYEGLGCIYWHMVSKLLLAAQETFQRAADTGAPPAMLRQLADCYQDIRAGIGDHKSPDVYGAFPMDPYSHTPAHAGARQPGLTGQVKEDILCRLGELGVFVKDGRIHFQPRLLRREEFLTSPTDFEYFDPNGTKRRIHLPVGTLAFTYGQVPVVYQLAREDSVQVKLTDGTTARSPGLALGEATSRSVFDRAGSIRQITVSLSSQGRKYLW